MTPRFYDVPAGTPATTCRGETCHARVFWIRTPKGRPLLIDCDVEGGIEPSETNLKDQGDMFAADGLARVFDGQGVPHWGTCADAESFHR